MVHIVSDTSTLYSTRQAEEAGFAVSALSVTIADRTYREFDEISSEEFVEIIRQGHMPTSSQPAVGEVAEVYDRYPGEEILNVTMALGLSGTYTGALAAADLSENRDNITVLNTRTLCGPHRYLVEKAVQWAKEGQSKDEIVEKLNVLMDSAKSYLVPADFDYLRRGGRLSPLVSYVGKAANLNPDRRRPAADHRRNPPGLQPCGEAYCEAAPGKGNRQGLAGVYLPRRSHG